MEIRPLAEEEWKYTYRQSMQLRGQTGCAGYLDGDFGSAREYRAEWKDQNTFYLTEEFREDFTQTIAALRSGEYGLLQNPDSMGDYTRQHPECVFPNGKEYGLRVDTENYAYLIRCSPEQGDFHCFCYVSKWLDRHMENARGGIRFIDSHYKELFRIADGERIVVTAGWGEKFEYACRFIDDYHFETSSAESSSLFHICEFAERMEKNGARYAPKQEETVKNQSRER